MLPAPETREFLIVGCRFLARLFRELDGDGPRRVVLPTNEDFPFAHLAGDDLVQALFDQTARYVGVDPEGYHLMPHEGGGQTRHEDNPGSYGSRTTRTRSIAGTYSVDGTGTPVITYDIEGTNDTDALVATFAHELAHDLLHVADVDPPGPPESDEPFTDLAAAYLGFGIFGANAAHRFRHTQDGVWIGYTVSRGGYLSVVEWGYALALHAHVSGTASGEIRRHLSRVAEEAFVAAYREIGRHHGEAVHAIRARLPLDASEIARAASPKFGAHVEAPGLFARLFGRD